MNTSTLSQAEVSWRSLWTALSQIRQYLEQQVAHVDDVELSPDVGSDLPSDASVPPSHLEHLCHTFGLSTFERALLLLCVGMELDHGFAALCTAAQGDEHKPYPTFDLALAALPDPHWSALTPTAPLRRWRLIEIAAGQTLTLSPLRVDEWVLHYLTGAACDDERMMTLIQPLQVKSPLVPSHQQFATQLAALWQSEATPTPIAQLCGQESASKQAIATAAAAEIGWTLYTLSILDLPTQTQDLHTLITLWQRAATLQSLVLLIDCDPIALDNSPREDALIRLIQHVHSPVVITSRERWQPPSDR